MPAPTLSHFRDEAQQWLEDHVPARVTYENDGERVWGEGRFNVAVFHSLSFDATWSNE